MTSTEWTLLSQIEPPQFDAVQLPPEGRGEVAKRFSELIGNYGFEAEINIDQPAQLMWCTHEDMIELAPAPNPLAELWAGDEQPNKCVDIYLRLDVDSRCIAVTVEGLSLLRFARSMEDPHELPWLPSAEPLRFENFETAVDQVLALTEQFLSRIAIPVSSKN